MVDGLNVLLMFPGCTHDAAELERVLIALESEPLLAPTHASQDERKRVPYDRAALVAAATRFGGFELWRTKAPKYEGRLTNLDQSHNKFHADLAPPLSASDVSNLFEATTRLAETLKPEFGFVHMLWKKREGSEDYNYGMRASVNELARLGLNSVHARTWFGPDVVKAVGEEHFLALLGTAVQRTSWGGVQLDLVEQPWTADYETLYRRQREVLDALRPLGVLGDYKGPPIVRKPAPKWPGLPWRMPRRGK
jgi:hypothetical protein